MRVTDLNREQLNQLKQSYLDVLVESGDIHDYGWGDLVDSENIPDDVIFNYYDGVTFTEDDFGK